MASSCIMMAALFTMAGAGVDTPVSAVRKNLIVAMIAVFGVGFATGFGPITYVVSSEVPSLRLRDETARVGFGTNVLFK